jgi:uncharacterized protein YprB with RNaseH-like and TPR domain
MQVDAQDYLDLVEQTHNLAFWDIESNNLRADYGSVLVASIKPFGEKPYSFTIKAVGNDVRVVRDLKEALEQYQCWCTFYGKGFDLKFVNSRLLKWGYEPIEPRHHIDLYFTGKANLLLSRGSMAQMAGFLGTHNQKMGVSPNVWSEIGFKLQEHLPQMVERCESDCAVLEDNYRKVRHVIKEIKKG